MQQSSLWYMFLYVYNSWQASFFISFLFHSITAKNATSWVIKTTFLINGKVSRLHILLCLLTDKQSKAFLSNFQKQKAKRHLSTLLHRSHLIWPQQKTGQHIRGAEIYEVFHRKKLGILLCAAVCARIMTLCGNFAHIRMVTSHVKSRWLLKNASANKNQGLWPATKRAVGRQF